MLKNTKFIIIILSVLVIITLIITLVTRSLKTVTLTQTKPLSPTVATISALMRSSDATAAKTKAILLPKLPIVISNFDTSVGLKTNIVISSYKNDDPNTVRVEISGIDYQYNQNNPQINPNMTAFKESFEKVVSLLAENKANIKDLHISLSNKQYIREISEIWIKDLNLLP